MTETSHILFTLIKQKKILQRSCFNLPLELDCILPVSVKPNKTLSEGIRINGRDSILQRLWRAENRVRQSCQPPCRRRVVDLRSTTGCIQVHIDAIKLAFIWLRRSDQSLGGAGNSCETIFQRMLLQGLKVCEMVILGPSVVSV